MGRNGDMTMASRQQAVDSLFFWWQAGPERWFSADEAFDRQIADRGSWLRTTMPPLEGWTIGRAPNVFWHC